MTRKINVSPLFVSPFFLMPWILAAITMASTPAAAASFDCTKAVIDAEKIVCANKELSNLDERLATLYKAAIDEAKDKAAVRQEQIAWLRSRDACKDATCLKTAYEKRIEQLLPGMPELTEPEGANQPSPPAFAYRFALLKGAGIPVCEAYLQRLNTAAYNAPAYCDRPEETNVAGFSGLNRVLLSDENVHVLYPRVSKFMILGQQGSKEEDERHNEWRKSEGLGPEGETLKNVRNFRHLGDLKAWRYDPPTDIDNDGKHDNVVVWQGIGAGGGTGRCGEVGPPIFSGPKRSIQVAYITDAANSRIEVEKTKTIFGHPSGGYRLPNGEMARGFRPVGRSIGIFKYQGRYYFDTFFDDWGDFDGKRSKMPGVENILAVLLHESGKTRQVCEYRMTEMEASTERK